MKSITCCFTGAKTLPKEHIEGIIIRLDRELDRLLDLGVTNFLSGGVQGFDLIAASMIAAKKELGLPFRLRFVLPCRDHTYLWGERQRALYQGLLSQADGLAYISEVAAPGSIKKRDRYLLDNSAHCIAAYGSPQMAGYARKKGVRWVDLVYD